SHAHDEVEPANGVAAEAGKMQCPHYVLGRGGPTAAALAGHACIQDIARHTIEIHAPAARRQQLAALRRFIEQAEDPHRSAAVAGMLHYHEAGAGAECLLGVLQQAVEPEQWRIDMRFRAMWRVWHLRLE